MRAHLARIVMTAAAASLGPHRCDWKDAMEAEFDAASHEGGGLSFAIGCLTTAWRQLPGHVEGRLTLASYTFVLGLILPAAALLLVGVLDGYPYVDPAYADVIGSFVKADTIVPRLHAGNASAVPVLGFVLLLRVASDVLSAWFACERDWIRAAAAQRFGAATTITLALFAGLVFLDETCLVVPVLSFAIELLAITLLRQWHDDAEEYAALGGASRQH